MTVDFAKELPIPAKDGYTFKEWTRFDDKIVGMRLHKNITITASWTPNS